MKVYYFIFAVFLCMSMNAQKIEYFIDTDPGIGSATLVSFENPDEVTFNINLSGLNDGFHNLYIRAQDEDGVWGIPLITPVFIYNAPVANKIVYAEYFFDSDPGFNNAIEFDTSGTALCNVSYLDYGKHNIYIRVKDDVGRWNVPTIKDFCKKPVPVFAIENNYACVGESFNYIDESTLKNSETLYEWDFNGDGLYDSKTIGDVNYTFDSWGEYKTRLILKQPDGCADTIIHSAYVSDIPTVNKPEGDTLLCRNPGTTQYIVKHTGYPETFTWEISPEESYDSYTQDYDTINITWNSEYTGDMILKVKAQNSCDVSSYSEHLDVEILSYPVADFITEHMYKSKVAIENTSNNYDRSEWDFGDGRYSEQNSSEHVFRPQGQYNVQLVVWNQICPDTTMKKVNAYEHYIIVLSAATSFSTDKNPLKLKIYPNPTSDKLILSGTALLLTKSINCYIYNSSGQLVKQVGISTNNENPVTIDVNNLRSGFYTLKTSTAQGSFIHTFIILK